MKAFDSTITEKDISSVNDVLRSGSIAFGPNVNVFEERFSKHSNKEYNIGLNSASSAAYCLFAYLYEKYGSCDVYTPSIGFTSPAWAAKKNNHNVYFLDGIYDIEKNEWKQLVLFEISSPTKISALFSHNGHSDCTVFLTNTLPQLIKDLDIKKIIVGRKLWKDIVPNQDTDVRFLNKNNSPFTESQWEQYLIHTNWYKEKTEIKEDDSRTNINWNLCISSTSIQICDLCNQFNLVN